MNKLDCSYAILFGLGTLFGVGLHWLYTWGSRYLFKTPLKLIKGGKDE